MTSKTAHRSLLAASVAAALALSGCANADADGNGGSTPEYTLIAGHAMPAGTPYDVGLNYFADLVKEKTDGRVAVEVHPSGSLGNETELFQGMQGGAIDIAVVAPGSIGEFAPATGLLSAPFLIQDLDHRDAVINGEVGKALGAQLQEKTGIETLTYFGGSIRQMLFTDPAESLDDIQGRLLRVQPAAMLADSFAAVGLQPTVVAYGEIYNSLQQGMIDGAENEAMGIDSNGFHEVAPYILQTDHEVTIRMMLAAAPSMDRLGDELAGLVQEAAQETGKYQREHEAKVDADMLIDLGTRDGVSITKVDTSDVRATVEPVWYNYAEEWGVEDLLTKIIDLRRD